MTDNELFTSAANTVGFCVADGRLYYSHNYGTSHQETVYFEYAFRLDADRNVIFYTDQDREKISAILDGKHLKPAETIKLMYKEIDELKLELRNTIRWLGEKTKSA